MRQDLASTIHSSGRIKTGKKTAHNYDEDTLTSVAEYLEQLNNIHVQLVDLEKTNSRMFKVNFTAPNRSSRMKKQNKHKASKRKELRKIMRMKEMLNSIAPTLKVIKFAVPKKSTRNLSSKLKGKGKFSGF